VPHFIQRWKSSKITFANSDTSHASRGFVSRNIAD
jgi:hypothetical protein